MNVTIACVCPPKADGERRHETDTVTLRDRLGFREVTTIRKATELVGTDDLPTRGADILAVLSEFYLLYGIESWSILDSKGKRLEVSKAAIRSIFFEDLDHFESATMLTDAADDLYRDFVLLPLVVRALQSSPTLSMGTSTSAKPASGTQRPKPSKRSSTSTTRTGGTGTITALPGGASSTSRSAASAS